MSNQAPTQPPAPEQPPAPQHPAPPAPPKKASNVAIFAGALLLVAVVSLIADTVAANAAVATLKDLGVEELLREELTASYFNPGTMYANVVVVLVVAVLAFLGRNGNMGARITGGIFAIFTAIGACIGLVIAIIKDNDVSDTAELLGGVSPIGWYGLTALSVFLFQLVLSILVAIKLFRGR